MFVVAKNDLNACGGHFPLKVLFPPWLSSHFPANETLLSPSCLQVVDDDGFCRLMMDGHAELPGRLSKRHAAAIDCFNNEVHV